MCMCVVSVRFCIIHILYVYMCVCVFMGVNDLLMGMVIYVVIKPHVHKITMLLLLLSNFYY